MNRTDTRESRRKRSPEERGHLMAGLMIALTIMLILSSVAFQAWSDVIRRDNEAEMIFRAQDLVRAIQRYRKDHGGMAPLQLELLMEEGPRGQFYLRHLWDDPLVSDGKWGLLFIGPGGQIVDPHAMAEGGGMGGLGGGLGGLGGGSGLGGSSGLGGGGGLGGVGNNQNLQAGQFGKGKGASGGLPGSPLNAGDPSQVQGLPIAGVRTLCEEDPFRVYNGLTQYNEWLFTYLDLELRAVPGGQGKRLNPGAGPGSGLQQIGGQQQGGFGGRQQGGLGGQQPGGLGGRPGQGQPRPGQPRPGQPPR